MNDEREFIMYCDESVKAGAFFSSFYGGAIVGASQIETVQARLRAVMTSHNLLGEVKWQKVTDAYLEKYRALIDAFFDEVDQGRIKVRIMFRQNARVARGLTAEQAGNEFYLLYYQFVKHAFGLASLPTIDTGRHLRLYFDEFPDTGEQVERFRGFLLGLNRWSRFRGVGLCIRKEDIAEVRSHDHVVLQCLDVVLGAMAFRLNDLHKAKPAGSRVRGKRTRAKDMLYRHILSRVRRHFPQFNIGITTGGGGGSERWAHPYRHWCFTPRDHDYDASVTKGKK